MRCFYDDPMAHVQLQAEGGVPPYEYAVDGTPIPGGPVNGSGGQYLPAGEYNVSVTDRCNATTFSSVEVEQLLDLLSELSQEEGQDVVTGEIHVPEEFEDNVTMHVVAGEGCPVAHLSRVGEAVTLARVAGGCSYNVSASYAFGTAKNKTCSACKSFVVNGVCDGNVTVSVADPDSPWQHAPGNPPVAPLCDESNGRFGLEVSGGHPPFTVVATCGGENMTVEGNDRDWRKFTVKATHAETTNCTATVQRCGVASASFPNPVPEAVGMTFEVTAVEVVPTAGAVSTVMVQTPGEAVGLVADWHVMRTDNGTAVGGSSSAVDINGGAGLLTVVAVLEPYVNYTVHAALGGCNASATFVACPERNVSLSRVKTVLPACDSGNATLTYKITGADAPFTVNVNGEAQVVDHPVFNVTVPVGNVVVQVTRIDNGTHDAECALESGTSYAVDDHDIAAWSLSGGSVNATGFAAALAGPADGTAVNWKLGNFSGNATVVDGRVAGTWAMALECNNGTALRVWPAAGDGECAASAPVECPAPVCGDPHVFASSPALCTHANFTVSVTGGEGYEVSVNGTVYDGRPFTLPYRGVPYTVSATKSGCDAAVWTVQPRVIPGLFSSVNFTSDTVSVMLAAALAGTDVSWTVVDDIDDTNSPLAGCDSHAVVGEDDGGDQAIPLDLTNCTVAERTCSTLTVTLWAEGHQCNESMMETLPCPCPVGTIEAVEPALCPNGTGLVRLASGARFIDPSTGTNITDLPPGETPVTVGLVPNGTLCSTTVTVPALEAGLGNSSDPEVREEGGELTVPVGDGVPNGTEVSWSLRGKTGNATVSNGIIFVPLPRGTCGLTEPVRVEARGGCAFERATPQLAPCPSACGNVTVALATDEEVLCEGAPARVSLVVSGGEPPFEVRVEGAGKALDPSPSDPANRTFMAELPGGVDSVVTVRDASCAAASGPNTTQVVRAAVAPGELLLGVNQTGESSVTVEVSPRLLQSNASFTVRARQVGNYSASATAAGLCNHTYAPEPRETHLAVVYPGRPYEVTLQAGPCSAGPLRFEMAGQPWHNDSACGEAPINGAVNASDCVALHPSPVQNDTEAVILVLVLDGAGGEGAGVEELQAGLCRDLTASVPKFSRDRCEVLRAEGGTAFVLILAAKRSTSALPGEVVRAVQRQFMNSESLLMDASRTFSRTLSQCPTAKRPVTCDDGSVAATAKQCAETDEYGDTGGSPPSRFLFAGTVGVALLTVCGVAYACARNKRAQAPRYTTGYETVGQFVIGGDDDDDDDDEEDVELELTSLQEF